MGLYKARPGDGVAWVTGAGRGIGRALALDLAREGYVVAATARNAGALDEVAKEAAGLPGRVVAFPCDVADEAGMRRTVAAIEDEAGPIALAVFNAGIFRPINGAKLDTNAFVESLRINLFGVVFGLAPLVERMRRRGRGQIAFMGSASSYLGLPTAGAYGSSKAALNNFAASVRYDLHHLNIRVQVINPGFVDTAFVNDGTSTLPALVPVDRASRRIMAGLRSGRYETAFPRRLVWFLKFLRILPHTPVFRFLDETIRWDRRRILRRKEAAKRNETTNA